MSTQKTASQSEVSKPALEQLAEQQSPSLIAEFWDFLKNNKKWWLLPILLVMLLFGLLVIASSSAVAPFIYTLF